MGSSSVTSSEAKTEKNLILAPTSTSTPTVTTVEVEDGRKLKPKLKLLPSALEVGDEEPLSNDIQGEIV